MKSFSNLLKNPLKLAKYLVLLIICITVVLYAWFQISSGISSDIETSPAIMTELNRTVSTRGYIFRQEEPVNKTSGGTVVTIAFDGQRISKGEKLAAIYHDSGEVSLQDDINRIQRRIDVLDKSAVETEYLVSDIQKVDTDISDTLNDIYISVESGNLSSAVNHGSDLLVKFNKRELIVNSKKNFNDERATLMAEKAELESRINAKSTPVYASHSGYYYGTVDGYENIFTPDLLDDMTIDEFKELTNAQADTSAFSQSAGKIVNDFVWYVGCSVASSELSGFVEGRDYQVSFPESGDKIITMKLHKIVRETSNADAVLVFRSNINPDNFSYQRAQKIEIVRGSVEGLQIPKQALRVSDDGVKGVYILFGDVVHFKRAEIIAETDNYYLISTNKDDYYAFNDKDNPEKDNIGALSLYDNVIVAGKDLFEGKIIG